MKPTIPYGGFIAGHFFDSSQDDFLNRLNNDSKCTYACFDEGKVVLGAWSQFLGQGLWADGVSGVAFDVDLINLERLAALAECSGGELADAGLLLWKLYQKYGQDFTDKLRGAFAFAIWDGKTKKLIVATDYYGIRPVVFSQQSSAFLAASHIRKLALTGIDKELNPEAIYHYLFFQAICSPVSIYKDVSKLEAGNQIVVSGRQVENHAWYDLDYQPDSNRDEKQWCQAIREEVEKAVGAFAQRPNSQAIGCFLSGGTDSSSIAGVCSQVSSEKVKTFSIGFDDPQYNELDFAQVAVKHFGTEQYQYLVTPEDVLELVNYLPQIYDEPFGNASVIAAYFCAKLAGENGVDVILGGDGGDEIFGGNERYVTDLVFRRYAKLPDDFRRNIFEPILGLMPSVGPFYKAKRYVRRANFPNPRRFYSYNLLAEIDNGRIFQPDFLATVDTDCFFKRAQTLYDHVSGVEETNRLLYLDMKYTITDNDLRKVTQMVEAAGLQVRYPLLDRDLVDFTCSIPADLKVKPGKNRYIFKQAMQGFLPDEIINKSKHGMGLPIAKWLRDDKGLNELMEESLFSQSAKISSYVRLDYLKELKAKLYSEDTPYYGDNLWVFLVLEMWLKFHD